ncbi:hypothetical protein, partial [Kocuria rhizophila]|uniref:hypothetical protein n=1 Tax=Kocuria rhizophila TaxID=72000 RepID=UPI001C92DAFC
EEGGVRWDEGAEGGWGGFGGGGGECEGEEAWGKGWWKEEGWWKERRWCKKKGWGKKKEKGWGKGKWWKKGKERKKVRVGIWELVEEGWLEAGGEGLVEGVGG